jgi:hypothetical protein
METEATEAVRQAGNLQNVVNQHRILLESRPKNEDGKENIIRMNKSILGPRTGCIIVIQ